MSLGSDYFRYVQSNRIARLSSFWGRPLHSR